MEGEVSAGRQNIAAKVSSQEGRWVPGFQDSTQYLSWAVAFSLRMPRDEVCSEIVEPLLTTQV